MIILGKSHKVVSTSDINPTNESKPLDETNTISPNLKGETFDMITETKDIKVEMGSMISPNVTSPQTPPKTTTTNARERPDTLKSGGIQHNACCTLL